MTWSIRTLLLLGASLLAACSTIDADSQTALRFEAIDSPAPPESAQPQLTATSDGRPVLSWLEKHGPKTRFRLAVLGSAGWSEPVTITESDRFFANWADVPSVIALSDGRLAAHWLAKSGPDTYAYDVVMAISRDNGRTWSTPFSPHTDGTKTEHGFASMFEFPKGRLGLIWLDGRDFAKYPGAHGEEGMKAEMSLRASMFDADRPGAEMLVDKRVCDCCPTTATVTAKGVVVAYRDRSPKEIRDIYLSRYEKGRWSAPAVVHADGWQIPGCPVNGPALASDRGQNVVMAWFAAPENQAHVSVVFSRDAAATFGRPIRVDDGKPLGRVDVELLPDGSSVVTWIELTGGSAQVRARQIWRDGRRSAPITIAEVKSDRSSGYPRVTRAGDRLVFAWVAPGKSPQVKLAAAALPGVKDSLSSARAW